MSRESDVVDLGCECGVVARSGTWFSFGETRLGQGRENVRQFLRDNPDVFEQLRAKVVEVKRPKPPVEDPDGKLAPKPDEKAEEKQPVRATGSASRKVPAAASRKR